MHGWRWSGRWGRDDRFIPVEPSWKVTLRQGGRTPSRTRCASCVRAPHRSISAAAAPSRRWPPATPPTTIRAGCITRSRTCRWCPSRRPTTADTAPDGKPPKRRSRIKPALVLLLLMLLSLFAWWLVQETRTSSMQAQLLCQPRQQGQLQGRAGSEQLDPLPVRQPVRRAARLRQPARLPGQAESARLRNRRPGAAVAEGGRAGRHGPVRHLPRKDQGRPGHLRLPRTSRCLRRAIRSACTPVSTPRRRCW